MSFRFFPLSKGLSQLGQFSPLVSTDSSLPSSFRIDCRSAMIRGKRANSVWKQLHSAHVANLCEWRNWERAFWWLADVRSTSTEWTESDIQRQMIIIDWVVGIVGCRNNYEYVVQYLMQKLRVLSLRYCRLKLEWKSGLRYDRKYPAQSWFINKSLHTTGKAAVLARHSVDVEVGRCSIPT